MAGHRRPKLSQPVTNLASQLHNRVLFGLEFPSYTLFVSGHGQ